MRKFILLILLFLISTVSVFLALKIIFNKDKKNYNSAFVDKLQWLKANGSKKKIILFGGSNVGFGLSAEMIEAATGIPTYNLGQQAGLGLVDYQSFLIKHLTKQDLIIFAPEWHFYGDPEFHDENLDNLVTDNKEYANLIGGYKQKLEYLFSPINFKYAEYEGPNTPYIYHCINKNGDIISQCSLKPAGPIYYTFKHSKFSFDQFKKLFPFLVTNRTVFLFPSTQVRVYNENRVYLKQIENELVNRKCMLANSVEDNVYPDSLFFDLGYHLTCDTRTARTEKFISYLKSTVLK